MSYQKRQDCALRALRLTRCRRSQWCSRLLGLCNCQAGQVYCPWSSRYFSLSRGRCTLCSCSSTRSEHTRLLRRTRTTSSRNPSYGRSRSSSCILEKFLGRNHPEPSRKKLLALLLSLSSFIKFQSEKMVETRQKPNKSDANRIQKIQKMALMSPFLTYSEVVPSKPSNHLVASL